MTGTRPLLAVLGPTASGKSHLALSLAESFDGEIVNCDSLQLYRYMDIGTAKTPFEERRGIRHHLLDILDPDQVFTAGEYAGMAREAVRDIARRGKTPIVAGGTGFYFRAMLDGIFEGPAAHPALRARLARRTPQHLFRLLNKLDRTAASRMHENDVKKVIRALEVCLTARARISDLQPQRVPLAGFTVLRIALAPPRDALYTAINHRCKEMFERGIMKETHFVVEHFGRNAKALEAIGYAEAARVLDGILSVEQAIALAQQNTRRYAKRQMTWFRREPDTKWLEAFGNQLETVESAIRYAAHHKKNIC